jgi:hypothetical protein
MGLIGAVASVIGNVDSPQIDFDASKIGGRIQSVVGETIDLIFPILLLLTIAIALTTFLVGYFEFATSMNPHTGLRKGLRGLFVFIGLIIVFGNFSEIEQLAGASVSALDVQGTSDASQTNGMTSLFNDLMIVFGMGLLLGLFIIAACSLVVLLWGLGQLTLWKPSDPERRTATRVIGRAVIGVLGVIVPLGMQFPQPPTLFPVYEAVLLLIIKGGFLS